MKVCYMIVDSIDIRNKLADHLSSFRSASEDDNFLLSC